MSIKTPDSSVSLKNSPTCHQGLGVLFYCLESNKAHSATTPLAPRSMNRMHDSAIRCAPLALSLSFVWDVDIGERLVQVLRLQLQELGVVLRRGCGLPCRVFGLQLLRLLRSKRRRRGRDRAMGRNSSTSWSFLSRMVRSFATMSNPRSNKVFRPQCRRPCR